MTDRDARLRKKVQTAPQQIASLIKEAILEGSLPPGAQLPSETEMAENFGVSRPTIREALRTLKSTGVITAARGRHGGHRISDGSTASLARGMGDYMTLAIGANHVGYRDIFEVRSELDLLAASTAAQRRTEEDVDALRELAGTESASGSVEAALRYDLAFHRKIAECSHNQLIVAFMSATIVVFQDCDVDLDMFSQDSVLAHLDDVREAVIAGDSGRAREAMHRHVGLSGALCGVPLDPARRPR